MTLDEPRRPTVPEAVIASLLDRAVHAVNEGDLVKAHDLAGQVLAEDAANRDASLLLATDEAPGELRRLTIMVCDLVGSTELSDRLELERYRALVRTYQRQAREIVEARYDGHVDHLMGDGLFSLFGYPTAHEDDAARAVQAALDICGAVRALSQEMEGVIGEPVSVRAAVHRGLVFIDSDSGEVYGLAANVAARLEGTAEPGHVVVSEEIRRLVADRFAIEPAGLRALKGISNPLATFRVVRAVAAGAHQPTARPLVGRDHELLELQAAWRATAGGADGAPTCVLIRGEAGVGKTRLASALIDSIASAGIVIELAGSALHADVGFHPVRRLLEERCQIQADTPAPERLERLREELDAVGHLDDLALVAPVLGLPPGAGYPAPSIEGRQLNEDITAAVRRHLVACLGHGPSLLAAEDVHWFDESTLTLLRGLVDAPPDGVLVLCTARGGAELPISTTLDLAPLTVESCHQLIDELSDRVLHADERRTLVDRSDGIPLYLEELVRGGDLSPEGTPAAVPDVLYEHLVATLYRTDHGVAVAGAAATIGREIERSVLVDAVGLGLPEIDAELDALVAGRVLLPVDGGARYRFRHELLRDVAYELQPESVRAQVHGVVADLLRAAHSGDPALVDWSVVAAHYAHAGRAFDGADAYQQASELARARGAIAEARAHLGRALDLLDALPEDRARIRCEAGLRLRRGSLAMFAETVGSVDAAHDFARCLELAILDPHGDDMRSALISLWSYHLARAELDQADEVAGVFRTSLTGDSDYLLAAHRAGNGMVQWLRGDFDRARTTLEAETVNLSASWTPEVDAVWYLPGSSGTSAHTFLALACFMGGDTAAADAQLALCSEVVAGLGFPQGPWSEAYSAWLQAWISVERGRLDEAAAVTDAMVAMTTRHGFDGLAIMGMTNQAAISATRATCEPGVDRPEIEAASTALAGFVDLWVTYELLVFVPYYLTTVATGLAAAGDRVAARHRCQDALALAERTGMHFYDAETRRRLALLGEDADAVARDLQAALQVARAQRALPFELRIALDLDERGVEGGRAALERAVSGFPPHADLADLDRACVRLGADDGSHGRVR